MINILINDLSHTKSVIRDSTIARIKYWQKNNCQISILTNIDGKKFYSQSLKNINFLIVKNTKFTNKKFFFILESIKRNYLALKFIPKNKNKFDVIFSISSVLDLIIFPYFLKLKNPKIIWCTILDNIVPISDPGNKIIRFLAWIFFQTSIFLIKKADIIFVVSPNLKEYLIWRHFNSSSIVITGNGIDTKTLQKAKPTSSQYDCLFIGRLNETKGIFDMLDVVYTVKIKIPNFSLAIIGEGDNLTKNKFIDKINRLNLNKNLILLGRKTGLEKFSILKSSKTFMFLSKSPSESFGIALLEAVSCGLPAFAYNLPAYQNIYKNNEINFSKINDTNSISKSILKTFQTKQFENKNGKKLLGKYTWEKIAKTEYDAFKKIYES